MAATKTISADVLSTLQMGKVEGGVYFLPPHRYSRERYVELAEVINNAGGKWNRKAKGFTFKGTPEAFRRALEVGETVNVQQVTQFFPTPPDVAARMASMIELKCDGVTVLEPSAGHGALAIAAAEHCARHSTFAYLTLIEKDTANFATLNDTFYKPTKPIKGAHCRGILQRDFLACTLPASLEYGYDAVIMNPPFSRGDDIKHILHAWEFLKVGGKLVALCANGPKQNKMLKPWAESLGGTWEVLPAGTFKDSGDKGTKIETVLLTANA